MTYRSKDGLCWSSDPAAVATWDSIATRHASEQATASRRLRALGVKLEHPDDGWVNRDEDSVSPCYPRFDLSPGTGDLIALGWPDSGYRLVRCTSVEHRGVLIPKTVYLFKDTGERLEGLRAGVEWKVGS